jgi:hypothetical protein
MHESIQDVLARLNSAANDDRKFQVLLLGSRKDVLAAIRTLHALGYAEVGAWSPVLPVPNSRKRMSILTKVRSQSS